MFNIYGFEFYFINEVGRICSDVNVKFISSRNLVSAMNAFEEELEKRNQTVKLIRITEGSRVIEEYI